MTDPRPCEPDHRHDAAPSGLRRLILALLVPDVIAWGWIVAVVAVVGTRSDAVFGSAWAASIAFTVAALASAAIARAVVAAVGDHADDTTLRPVAIGATVATVGLWLAALWLSFIAEVSA